ncbi:RDD family protein [Cognatilysobacter tabacisoli]|uniref:RDD family protein n=1 Tax=Cognatilysobacter tabacisoli TaxID=2315424 RepID=UPI0018C88B38|nr:RDD family protein [Lysobacter tabacisoli]
MSQWYYSDAQRNRHGPVATETMAELHAAGDLAADTLVWRDGLASWQPWSALVGEVVPASAGPAAAVSHATAGPDAPADAPANPYAMAEPRSPYAPPATSVDPAELHVAGGEVVYAGFWKRFAALAIDSLLVGVVYYALLIAAVLVAGVGMAGFGADSGAAGAGMLGLLAMVYLMYPVISALYYAGFESSARQATLGKMAVGIKVTDEHGRRLSRGQALARWASHLLCYVTIYIGYLMAAFTDRKRGLHDMVAGTLVVDQWAYTGQPERQRRDLGTVTVVVIALAVLAMLAYAAVIVAIAIPAYQQFVQGAAGA